MDNELAPQFEAVATDVRQLSDQVREERDRARVDSASATQRAHWMQLVALGATMLLAAGVAYTLTTGLTTQVGATVQHIRSSSSELQAAATQQASGA
jgi:hypothetical protein